MSSTHGLREQKKAETRRAVHHAAIRLATEHGYDRVTVEEIADAANISRRTFFNYFTDKAEAVMFGEEDLFRELLASVDRQPPELSGWEALRGALDRLLAPLQLPSPEWAARSRLARRHPCLLARLLAGQAELERDLAKRVTDRDDCTPERGRVVASAFLSAIRTGGHLWFDGACAAPLQSHIVTALDEVELPFA
ncbi:helix-turn-helix domain-containing protein [Actinocorallia sp. A-T 12471]|uniref:TetR/AcrR family transcriptional regulator n=1 Tax=Actinocorallia sp. A-T 12471 TaxID=3089813 RepID=UPI0029CE7E58|nr:helix-turn-helix domain-containing protein [Actinocorallia sp. A-T 12471]MDX6744143.1 helix-turn-helix domain-containing protein [Actinocorallia sp. A-T 12471]